VKTSKAQKVEIERNKQYNHPKLPKGEILENFTNIGRVWGALLSSHSGEQHHDVPPHLVSHMLVALKQIRAVVPTTYQDDDYVDGENYLKFAGRMDPQNPDGDKPVYDYD
jgi:hypothetical protein